MSDRIARRFAELAEERRGGLITFISAGDPDPGLSGEILGGLPAAGADLIELGMPFTDPMADGPAIQAAGLRALRSGMTLKGVLDMVRHFRRGDERTPVVLMGYYNPIHSYRPERFLDEAKDVGVDGLIIVDLPPEEDDELCLPAGARGIDFIRLATPTSDDRRLPTVLNNASGFVYYVSITGITGAGAPVVDRVNEAVMRLKRHTLLPVAVGFGIREPEQAAAIARVADAAVVGSALVQTVERSLDEHGRAGPATVDRLLDQVEALARGVRDARRAPA